MILTITLNPSVDRTLCVDRIDVGKEIRVRSVCECPGGKGVNVARTLKALGVPVRSWVLTDILKVAPRINTTIADSDGKFTRFLERGPSLSAPQWHRVEASLLRIMRCARVIVLSGSLPPGVPEDAYARLIHAVQANGRNVALDTSGQALEYGVMASPWCVKPNQAEAETLLGCRITGRESVRKALRSVYGYGIKNVLLSLGDKGLSGMNAEGVFSTDFEKRPGLTVGCGDAALAGFLASQYRRKSFVRSLRMAAACGTANVGALVPGDLSRTTVMRVIKTVKCQKDMLCQSSIRKNG